MSEPVHLRHAKLGGALCRAVVYPAPLVSEDVRYVTCTSCRARMLKPVFADPSDRVPLIEDTPSGVHRRPDATGNRVHAASRRRGVEGISPLCGKWGCGLLLSQNPAEVSCWNCKQVLRCRLEREVERG